ncbi:oxysterol-binding protein-related protein 11-like [Hydractinia symbiolongicarpus]|uniref:oxysterol-binding protein-related protein 11-like n=1 Tax=Hydractinia symbiolongicarpus TaxID=13093 RepID=UPI00254A8A6E|nr:oxysterol-binding protein-related protein 11-like [Hydractinia symbiolongicarpus]
MAASSFPLYQKLYPQNPTAGELNLDGLSDDEKERILQVVQKEQEFVSKETANSMKVQNMEGQLSKFTNLMKGWQFRWFVLDPEKGTLTYYLDKEKSRHRGTLSLAGAVISPSEEDSMSFMISASNGEVYKLRGTDAKDRQHWINLIRAVAEYHGQTIVKPVRPPPPKQTPSLLKRSATVSTTSPNISKASPLQKTKSFSHKTNSSVNHSTVSAMPPVNPIQEELRNIKDALNSVVEYHSSSVEALESGPESGDVASPLEEQVLLLKATSQATVNILQQCYSILQQQSIDLQGSAHARGLPAGAKIEWFEPHNTRLDRSDSTESIESSESTVDLSASLEDYLNVAQYADYEEADQIRDADEKLEDMEAHKSVVLHLLSQLKLGMDLTRIVLPTFVLEKRSLLEMYADFMAHSDLFVRISNEKTPEDRMLAVLEFYLTSFHIGRKSGVAKKPYNPILGEHFHCSFDSQPDESLLHRDSSSSSSCDSPRSTDSSHRTYFVAEQVSHHPPISAFYAECPSSKISLNAHIWTKSKFYGMSIGVVNVGEGVIHLPELNEDYIFTFPNAYCRSILTVPWIELGGRTFIKCPQTGYNATLTFHTKPFYGGKPNRVTCELKNSLHENEASPIICRGDGFWDGVMHLDFENQPDRKKSIDVSKLKVSPKRVRPLQMQSEHESRKLWHNVTESLKASKLEKATEAKHKLEQRQRNEAQERSTCGTEWKPRLFQKHSDSWLLNPNLALVARRKKSRSASST